MERDRTTDGNGTKRGQDRLRAWLLAGASAAALLAAGPALGQESGDERVYRREALAHAHAVEAAWRRLETYILDESAGAAGWTGAVPPAAVGWQAGWTVRGLEARYCGDTLLVYLAPEELKGVGRDHRAVHAAPHAYAGNGETSVLHWLENGAAQGGVGRASVALPACLSEAAAGGPLPTGRAALAGTVRDPYRHTTERVARERKEEDCGAGEHGEGRTLIREATQDFNGRGEAVGDPAHSPWRVSIDLCRADYSQWEHYTLACHWEAGPPHNRRMDGREVWRRLKTVTSEGESLGPPEFVSTSCWTGGALPPAPVPAVSETGSEETKSGDCPAGYTGSLGYRRTVTLRSTRFPWDAAPVTQTITGAWVLDSDDCVPEVEPDWGDPEVPAPDGQGGDPGGGLGAPGSDGCDPSPADTPGGGTDACSIDSSGFGDMSGGGGGGGGGQQRGWLLPDHGRGRAAWRGGRRADALGAAPVPRRLHDAHRGAKGDGGGVLRDCPPDRFRDSFLAPGLGLDRRARRCRRGGHRRERGRRSVPDLCRHDAPARSTLARGRRRQP